MGHQLTSVTVAGAELYSCVTVREPAWHSLGVNFADRAGLTVDEALAEAHQNFTVRTVSLTTTPDDHAGQEQHVHPLSAVVSVDVAPGGPKRCPAVGVVVDRTDDHCEAVEVLLR